ncbi:succinylglutamate desuccinylase/aspartoacylase family protein [Sediminicola luteus]|uniref:Succinylglutamate desuccinylase/Aspartoacylase catalytic domain-containing protein n=1 Tax=Sediminicola luteus TaxID=319238 RepID=A0A2A4GFF6_9FLAO|nr:succinylglutamate desuccinylase/aspartoacylase family protein [Sediminicola luteus]PCE66686.1 hypothetical protein B7P33_05180 [Sediminicola luteus]
MLTTQIHSKALDKTLTIGRIIGHLKGKHPGPTMIFVGGIHGNEPSGVFALQHVLQQLAGIEICGEIYALAGNLKALARSERYQSEDLNRLWTTDNLNKLKKGQLAITHDDFEEQLALYHCLHDILETGPVPFYFIDLHSTSGPTKPFMTVNDSLLNRYYSQQFPVPMILGIEEYLDGPLLSYINELGYVAFGFEGGQHDDRQAIENHIDFVWLALVFSGCIFKDAIPFQTHYDRLYQRAGRCREIHEIVYRHAIEAGQSFVMLPGFTNFEPISKGKVLAQTDTGSCRAPRSGKIFMPLYQNQGNDGFFIIKRIHPFFLRFSAWLRKSKWGTILRKLPGVQAVDGQGTLAVNLKTARFLAKDIFHLLGYRSKQKGHTHLIIKNREKASKTDSYIGAPWYNA